MSDEKPDEIRCTCPMMPNQFEGRVDGKPFYFRARHGGWSLQVNSDPDGNGIDGEWVLDGLHPHAGWWEKAEAEQFLRGVLARYKAGERVQ